MQKLTLAHLAMALSVTATSQSIAQNLLFNPEVNVNDDSWDNGIIPGSISWSAVDSRGCPGSGSLVLPCNAVSGITSTECMPYSALPFWVAFDIKGTEELETTADVTIRIEAFNGFECQSNVAFVDQTFENTQVTTTFQRFDSYFSSMPPLTQSVKLHLRVEWSHCAVVDGDSLYFDTLYLGTADRIHAHDFENGGFCPLSEAEGGIADGSKSARTLDTSLGASSHGAGGSALRGRSPGRQQFRPDRR